MPLCGVEEERANLFGRASSSPAAKNGSGRGPGAMAAAGGAPAAESAHRCSPTLQLHSALLRLIGTEEGSSTPPKGLRRFGQPQPPTRRLRRDWRPHSTGVNRALLQPGPKKVLPAPTVDSAPN